MHRPPPLRVDLAPSRSLRAFVVLTHGATLAIVPFLPLGLLGQASLALLVIALGLKAWQRELPAALVVRLDGTLALLGRDGSSTEATLRNGGYCSPALVSIVYRPLGMPRWRPSRVLAVLPDMVAADEHRRLRVWLGYSRSDDDAGEPASQARASNNAALSALDCRAIRSR